MRSDTERGSKSCAGLLQPIVAFVVGALIAALTVVTISSFVLRQFISTDGPAILWQGVALSSLLLVGLNAVGFIAGLACVPMVVRQHVRRVSWLSAGTGVLCVAIPTYAVGVASLVLVPLVAGVLAVAVMRSALRFGTLIADHPRAVCSNCGYSVGASVSERCPECGACGLLAEGGRSIGGDDANADSERRGVISQDTRCLSCGYNLRGLEEGDKCPECATTIALIEGTPPRRTGRRTILIAWSVLMTVVTVANFAAVGPYDVIDVAPHEAAEAFMRAWSACAVLSVVLIIVFACWRRAPVAMWVAAAASLTLSIVAVAVNWIVWVIILMSV